MSRESEEVAREEGRSLQGRQERDRGELVTRGSDNKTIGS